jgi:hypothetical protein
MYATVRTRLAMFAAVLGGLALLTGLQADEKKAAPAKPDADKPAEAARPVKPKPLSDSVKRGLKYLAEQQLDSGGWSQGGGWRVGDGGGRIEGAQVSDPADVGNTAIATLALIRAGNTPKEGEYAKNVARAVAFMCAKVEKADKDSLYVTDVKGTQLQSKIGPYVDTFLVSLVLAELKGKMEDDATEKRLGAALDKTIAKIEKNQREDGHFAGNDGWASVLSQGLANKGLARARQAGAKVSDKSLDRVANQVAQNFDPKSGTFSTGGTGLGGGSGGATLGGFGASTAGRTSTPTAPAAPAGPGSPGLRGPAPAAPGSAPAPSTMPAPTGAAKPTDAGVPIYNVAANLGSLSEVQNARRAEEHKAKEVLAKKEASKADREQAEKVLREIAAGDKLQAQATDGVVKQLESPQFVQGFGSNGGEEFLSFLNISETLLVKGGADWEKWDKHVTDGMTRAQDKDGSWSGQHCITGKTFCTAGALLVLMADRAPLPAKLESTGDKEKESPKK